jgi:hypothetical protein
MFRIEPEEAEEYSLPPRGLHSLRQIAQLLREHQYDHEVVSFLASVLENSRQELCGFCNAEWYSPSETPFFQCSKFRS